MSYEDPYNVSGGAGSAGGAGGFSGGLGAFANHMFSATPQSRAELWNAAQYGALAVVPVALLNRGLNWAVPEPDDESHSVMLLGEVLLQVIALFCGFVLVHRLITFVPTYSGFPYDKLSLCSVALAILAIMLSLKSKFGIKVSILSDRIGELWSGGGGGGKDGGGGGHPQQQQRKRPLPSAGGGIAPVQARMPLAGVQPAGNLIR